ncbi:helix-turn-helix domain-containing protein [Actinophytocola sp.]|uniref:helix-turn-helix domain-containing protein n=1 Tax=Actinophytocola sp. TaxID=1872138 RepID=UPI003D6A5CDF
MDRPATADYPPGARLPLRVIDDCEFVWMLRGRAHFVTETGTTPLTPGHLLLVPPGLRHGFDWDARHGYVHFTHTAVTDDPVLVPVLVPMSGDDPLAGLAAYLLWLGAAEPPGWRARAHRTLELMVTLVLAGPLPARDEAARPAPAARAAVEVLRREWARPPLRRVGVDELAAAVRVSRGYLNRVFRLGFDLGAAEALEGLRLSRAEALLLRTDLTLGAIARQCGFADLSHFSHRFAARYGLPPSRYRTAPAGPSMQDHPGVRRLAHLVWD